MTYEGSCGGVLMYRNRQAFLFVGPCMRFSAPRGALDWIVYGPRQGLHIWLLARGIAEK